MPKAFANECRRRLVFPTPNSPKRDHASNPFYIQANA
ncbi:hypothetical protein SAMN02927903_00227 [Flavobacterium caeni]|uniref:Uncharacterized protein n=1 Tax=Flavobacterium caeni TaxID=490189 RepID=A0A1G5B292_9FLAO|nr:hypothetical protein SAMN02927903_00227 [Flavobacterium caeni]